MAACLACAGCAAALREPAPPATPGPDQPRPEFYQSLDYGSEAQFNPLNEVLNEGLDMLRMEGANRRLYDRRDEYKRGLENVLRSIARPDRVYGHYGWGRALRNEILPLTFSKEDGGGAWGPNYTMHLIGSGMVSARMVEWYEQHGSSHPVALSFAAMTLAHFVNEVYENTPASARYSVDAATDLLIFDPAGFLLFRVPAVRKFFSRTVQLTNWPGQPTWVVPGHTVENTGQQYILRGPLPWTDRWRWFHGFGVEMLAGVTRDFDSGYALSVAMGGAAFRVRVVDERTGAETVDFEPAGGVFLDRNGSLLVSVRHMLGRERDPYGSDATLAVNVYPGVVKLPLLGDPGVWLHVLRGGGVRLGVVARSSVGLGVLW
ncbi:MAG: hypothetical protein ACYC6F_00200 [Longimicrobiales bacterium]